MRSSKQVGNIGIYVAFRFIFFPKAFAQQPLYQVAQTTSCASMACSVICSSSYKLLDHSIGLHVCFPCTEKVYWKKTQGHIIILLNK